MIAAPPLVKEQTSLVRLRLPFALTEDEFFDFCQLNNELRIEQTAEGDLEIMPPVAGGGSSRNARLTAQVTIWADQDATGVAFDATGGFKLPNGATRSPDAAWVLKSRLAQMPAGSVEKFLPLCPDFVVELRSPSDSLTTLKDKMDEYLANGARLGWLLDPYTHTVYVYRPGKPVETLPNPTTLSGEPLLTGFTLTLAAIWDAGF